MNENNIKINYQTELEHLLEKLGKEGRKPGLLLHSCCGPCSSYVLDFLKDYFKITVFYYNPNIYPESEYDLRLENQRHLIEEMNNEGASINLHTIPYMHSEFTDYVAGLENEKEGGARCTKCFDLRLKKTAEEAIRLRMDYFATTLTVSPHKNAVLLNKIGSGIETEFQTELSPDIISWLPSDFKKKEGYKKSIELSKKYGLYRQNYCGCEFSIWF